MWNFSVSVRGHFSLFWDLYFLFSVVSLCLFLVRCLLSESQPCFCVSSSSGHQVHQVRGDLPLVFSLQKTQPHADAQPRSDCRAAKAGESILVTQTPRQSPAPSQDMIWQCRSGVLKLAQPVQARGSDHTEGP